MTTLSLTADIAALMRRVAADAILPRFRQLAEHEIITKSPGELVTVADREAEVLLFDGLARLLPEAALVGEEACEADPALYDRLGDALCWIVDPIDGTHNFAQGNPPFGIMIALAQAGETVAGWIYDPLADRLCHAHRGSGAFVGDARIAARTTGQTPPIASISLVFMDPARREAVRDAVAPHYALVDVPRCAAEQYPRLVLGTNDVSIFERTLAWDHAAGVLFVNEAGGKAARGDGRAYRVDEAHLPGLLAAATPRQWDDLALRLQGV